MNENIIAAQIAALAVERNLIHRITARCRSLNGELIGAGSAPGIPKDTQQAVSAGAWGYRTKPRPPFKERKPPAMAHTIPGDFEVDRALAGFRPGDPIYWSNVISYVYIIAIYGRRRDRRGRMIGSLQAPDGTIRQAIANVAARWGGSQ